MRRALMATVAALGLVATMVPQGLAHGTRLPPRTVTKKYARAHGARGAVLTVGVFGTIYEDWLSFRTRPGEDRIDLEVTDDLGGPVAGSIYYRGQLLSDFCGSADNVRFNGGRRLLVVVWAGQCADTTPSVVSRGEIEVTFSDRR